MTLAFLNPSLQILLEELTLYDVGLRNYSHPIFKLLSDTHFHVLLRFQVWKLKLVSRYCHVWNCLIMTGMKYCCLLVECIQSRTQKPILDFSGATLNIEHNS